MSHHKGKELWDFVPNTNGNQTYCDHFVVYTNIKSLYCSPETNTMLYVNFTSIEKQKKKMKIVDKWGMSVCQSIGFISFYFGNL